MARVMIPIRRLHGDGSACEHRIGPNGKPRDGENCPGVAKYGARCKTADCGWTFEAGIRAVVEEQQRTHRASHQEPAPAAARHRAPVVARHADNSACKDEDCADVDHYTARCTCGMWSAHSRAAAGIVAERRAHLAVHKAGGPR